MLVPLLDGYILEERNTASAVNALRCSLGSHANLRCIITRMALIDLRAHKAKHEDVKGGNGLVGRMCRAGDQRRLSDSDQSTVCTSMKLSKSKINRSLKTKTKARGSFVASKSLDSQVNQ